MKALFLSFFFVLSSAFAQEEIRPLSELKTNARNMVGSLPPAKNNLMEQSPDYKHASNLLRYIVDRNTTELENQIDTIRRNISYHHRELRLSKKALKTKKYSSNLRNAYVNFKNRLQDQEARFQTTMKEFVLKDLDTVYKNCITVVCMQQIQIEIREWINKASRLNRELRIEGASIYPVSILEDQNLMYADMDNRKSLLSQAFVAEDEICKNLQDENISIEDIMKFGTSMIGKLGLQSAKDHGSPDK